MRHGETLSEIRELNLSYLVLAQRLIREDRAAAMFRLGVSNELADVLEHLSLAQLVKLAASNLLLCRFRFDDHAVLSSLTHHGRDALVQQSHAAMLLASQPAESL